jgi:hypothetical protein
MLNFFKRTIVRFLTRKHKLVMNKNSQAYAIVSSISSDGYVVLFLGDSYLPLQYKQYRDIYTKVSLVFYGDEVVKVVGVNDTSINLSSGESLQLCDINEPMLEDGIDTSW